MRIFTFFLTIYACLGLISCSVDEININNNSQSELTNLIEQKSPYSMDIMLDAYNYVKGNTTRGADINPSEVIPTHRYIKFTPKNRFQVDALNEHYTLYTFPLNEIPQSKSNNVINPLSNDGSLYAMIEYNAILPDSITFEEIGCYHNPSKSNLIIDEDLTEEVTRTAYAIASLGDPTRASELTPWRPSGTIRIWDDLTNDYIPMESLQVEIFHSQSTQSYTTETDENGYFVGKISFYDDVSYVIHWKGDEWAIKYDDVTPAITISSASRYNNFDLQINKNHIGAYYAGTIYRAATFYWHFASPYTPPTMSEDVRITCYNESSSGEPYNAIGLFYPNDREANEPIIEIWCKNHTSESIISTTFHELAHAAHLANAGNNRYYNTARIIKESWARYIQYKLVDKLYSFLSYITNIEYTSLLHIKKIMCCDNEQCFIEYTPDEHNIQYWYYNQYPDLNIYSPLFIDIADGFNQRSWFQEYNLSYINDIPNDKIRIANGELIEDLVFNNATVSDVKNDLIEYITINDLNISMEDINDLFEVYERI